jgi:hypothetical protein
MHNTNISDEEYQTVSNIVQNLLNKESIHIDKVIETLKPYRKEHVVKIIRWMIDDKIISINKNDYLSLLFSNTSTK